tara:strand:- start:11102 stop:11326 length:225 start_codon:yes stop_codon:yes gene_type:complete
MTDLTNINAPNERLLREIAITDSLAAQLGEAQAENKRLRDALQKIAVSDYNDLAANPELWACIIALTALKGQRP